MIIEIDDLKITIDYFNSNKLKFEDFFEVILCINDNVEKGYIAKEVMQRVFNKLGSKKVKNINTLSEIYYSFMKDYTEAMKQKKENVVYEHLILYDRKIERELQEPRTKNPRYYNKLKIDKLMGCLDTMKQKETLLGLHRKKMRIVLNNKMKFEKQKSVIEFSTIKTDKLTFDEKVELMILLDKAKSDTIKIPDHFDYDKMNKIEDIDYENIAMPEINSPIKQMQLTQPKKEEKPQAKTIEQIKSSILEKFKQLAEKRLKEIGVKENTQINKEAYHG